MTCQPNPRDSSTGRRKSFKVFMRQDSWRRASITTIVRNQRLRGFSGRQVPTSKVKEVAAMLKAIHAQEDRAAARQKAEQVSQKLKEMRLADAAAMVASGIEETLYYYAFPSEHWRCLRTNNPLERLLREVRRRTRA